MKSAVCALLGALVASGTAAAEPLRRIELGAGTSVPIAVGAEGTLRFSRHLDLDLGLGLMPASYVDLINASATALDGYDDATARVVSAALDHAVVVRLGAAIRPLPIPLALHGGYTLARGSGSVTGAMAIAAVEEVTGQDLHAELPGDVPLDATVHMFHVGASWRFQLDDRLLLRVSLEYTQPFDSTTRLDVPAMDPRVARASALLDAHMDDIYSTYVKAPVLGVSMRWLGP